MKFKTVLISAALSASVAMACAAPGDPITLMPSSPGTLSASFTQVVDDGSLIDTFNFSPMSFAGLVSVALTSLTGPVTFTNAEINDQVFGNLSDNLFYFSFQAPVTADTPLTLTVLRAVEDADGNPVGTGSYNVSLTAAVPEPRTWALMLAGLLTVALAKKAGAAASRPPRRLT